MPGSLYDLISQLATNAYTWFANPTTVNHPASYLKQQKRSDQTYVGSGMIATAIIAGFGEQSLNENSSLTSTFFAMVVGALFGGVISHGRVKHTRSLKPAHLANDITDLTKTIHEHAQKLSALVTDLNCDKIRDLVKWASHFEFGVETDNPGLTNLWGRKKLLSNLERLLKVQIQEAPKDPIPSKSLWQQELSALQNQLHQATFNLKPKETHTVTSSLSCN